MNIVAFRKTFRSIEQLICIKLDIILNKFFFSMPNIYFMNIHSGYGRRANSTWQQNKIMPKICLLMHLIVQYTFLSINNYIVWMWTKREGEPNF